jgi:ABC-type sugar transport system substrate-binding protein
LAADYAAALLSDRGKVAQLEGEPASETAQLRKKGFHEEIAKYKNIQLVSSITGHVRPCPFLKVQAASKVNRRSLSPKKGGS